MRCSKAQRLISDHIDGLLNEKLIQKLESHLEECPDCQNLFIEMKSMVNEVKQLEAVSPINDLWPDIKKQLSQRDRENAKGFQVKGIFSGFSLYPRQLAYSASAFLAGIIVMSIIYYGIPFIQTDTDIPDKLALSQFKEVEYHYQQAISALNQAISEQNVKLSPELEAVFRENLEIIDNSIRTFQAAIDKYPGDPDATEYLMVCYRKKLELLGEMKDIMMQSS